jgi:tetratricopeptide (TPR) repeat protein
MPPLLEDPASAAAVEKVPLRRKILSIAFMLVLVIGLFVFLALQKARQSSQSMVVQCNLRALQAAADQYYLENGVIYATYDDLVGPSRYIKALNPVTGEDYRSLGPIRQDHVEELRIKLPDGRVIDLYEPPGVPDGLQVVEFNNLRFETTYRRGWPDGPSRVVTKQGQVLSSANYVEGHIVGPCWYLGRDLNSPASRPPDALGREKLAAKNFAGAESDFTRAVATEPSYDNYVGRANARLGQGRFDPAIADYLAAMKAGGGRLQDSDLLKLKQAYAQQGAQRKAQGDAAGAAADDLAIARLNLPSLFAQAANRVLAKDYAAADALYTRIIQIQPGAAGYSKRSDVRFELGDLDGTLADLNEAIRLSPAPPSFYFLQRAWLYRLKNDLPGAAAEFRAVVGASPNDINRRGETCHAACWLYLVECERGQDQAAAEELARTVAQVDRLGPTTQVWYRLEADLLLGRITEEQLMAKVAIPADQPGESNRFQALFFAGMLHRRAGDTAGALDRFRRALQTTYAQQFVPDVREARRAVAAGPAGK